MVNCDGIGYILFDTKLAKQHFNNSFYASSCAQNNK